MQTDIVSCGLYCLHWTECVLRESRGEGPSPSDFPGIKVKLKNLSTWISLLNEKNQRGLEQASKAAQPKKGKGRGKASASQAAAQPEPTLGQAGSEVPGSQPAALPEPTLVLAASEVAGSQPAAAQPEAAPSSQGEPGP